MQLAGVGNAHATVAAIVKHAPLLAGGRGHEIPVALLTANAIVELVAQAFRVQVVVNGDANARALANTAPFGPTGDEVDQTAGGSQTMLGAGPVNHFNPLDHGEVDGVTITRAIAQRIGLRHAIDQEQRIAPAQRLSGVGQLLTAR